MSSADPSLVDRATLQGSLSRDINRALAKLWEAGGFLQEARATSAELLRRQSSCETVLVTDLRQWRAEHGLSQAAAAEAIGIGRTSWIGYESGAAPLPRYVQLALLGYAIVSVPQ